MQHIFLNKYNYNSALDITVEHHKLHWVNKHAKIK